MQYYKKIEIDYYDEIVTEVLYYLRERQPNIYNSKINNFNDLNVPDILYHCPKLNLGFVKYGLQVNKAIAFISYSNQNHYIHVDSDPNGNARINIPILNVIGTETRFYKGGEYKKVTNPNTRISSYRLVSFSNFELVDTVEIDQPTVIRVNEPHRVFLKKDASVPRITLSLGFDIDPIYMLED